MPLLVHLWGANVLPGLSLSLGKLDPLKCDDAQGVFLGLNHLAISLQVAEGPGYCTAHFHLQT